MQSLSQRVPTPEAQVAVPDKSQKEGQEGRCTLACTHAGNAQYKSYINTPTRGPLSRGATNHTLPTPVGRHRQAASTAAEWNQLKAAHAAYALIPPLPLKAGGGFQGEAFFHGAAFFQALPATLESLICWPDTGCHGFPFLQGW